MILSNSCKKVGVVIVIIVVIVVWVWPSSIYFFEPLLEILGMGLTSFISMGRLASYSYPGPFQCV